MSMIMGFAELLETRDDAETRSEAARGIVQAAARLRSTIESLTGTPLDNGASARDRAVGADDGRASATA